RRAADRRLVYGRPHRDRSPDHAHDEARRYQYGLRPDACRREHQERGDLLSPSVTRRPGDTNGDKVSLETVSTAKSFGGTQGVYRHASRETGTDMTFAVYLPPQAEAPAAKLPLLWYLSGLTCTHANVMEKGGYQHVCAE